MKQLHVADIIKINLILQNYNEALPIESYSQHRGGKGEFTDSRLPLKEPDVSESAKNMRQKKARFQSLLIETQILLRNID